MIKTHFNHTSINITIQKLISIKMVTNNRKFAQVKFRFQRNSRSYKLQILTQKVLSKL